MLKIKRFCEHVQQIFHVLNTLSHNTLQRHQLSYIFLSKLYYNRLHIFRRFIEVYVLITKTNNQVRYLKDIHGNINDIVNVTNAENIVYRAVFPS